MGTDEGRAEEIQESIILKRAVENTNEAFVTIDQDHRVFIFNKAAETIFGYRRDEVIGRDLNIIMSPTCSRNHRQAVERYVKTRAPRRIGHETEILATRKNGETFPASISFSVTQIEGRLFFTGIVRDMTETRALQEKILQSERLAALGKLVAEITHEIKNPLMMIGGFARQLGKIVRDEKGIEKLDIITAEVKRLEHLLSDLREFYLPRTVAAEKVNIKEILLEIFALVRDDFEKKGIRAQLDVDENALLVAGQANPLKQVFLNLIKNSIEAMDNGGNLTIVAKASGDMLEITVTDEGSGISEKDRDKIFSPFFTTKSDGTGLGLCISKRIVEEHMGTFSPLDAGEGKGATFKVSLPLYHEAPKTRRSKPEIPAAGG